MCLLVAVVFPFLHVLGTTQGEESMSTSNCVSRVRKNLARKTITYVLYTTITYCIVDRYAF
jgi:hypothetical protein